MIKLEIPNDPACINAARAFFNALEGKHEMAITPEEPTYNGNIEAVVSPATDTEWPQERDGVLYDSAGMPWDERIHVTTKTCKKDGTWKYGRGVQPLIIEEVEAELKSAQTAPVEQPAAPVEQPAGDPLTDIGVTLVLQPTFLDLCQLVTPVMNHGKMTQEQINAICQLQGFEQPAFAANATPEQIKGIYDGIVNAISA